MGSEGHGDEVERAPVRTVEFVVGVVSGVLLVSVLGLLGYQAVAVRDAPPALRTRVDPIGDTDQPPYVFQVQVRNTGGQTAQAVQITGQLTRDGRQVEQAYATVRYIPPNSRRTVSLLFETDPETAPISVKVAGYTLADHNRE